MSAVELPVVTTGNEKAGTLALEPSVFAAPVREHLHQAEVRRQLADRRRGTHASRNRSAVSGGGAKPWRQKGTGRARQGSTRSPQWAGGGVVFGPVPRDHAHRLPKKMRAGALRSAVSQRVSAGDVVVVDAFELDAIKTRRVVEILATLGLADHSVLIVLPDRDERVERSTRNLARVGTLPVAGLNVYDVLRHEKLVLTREAAEALGRRLAPGRGEGGA